MTRPTTPSQHIPNSLHSIHIPLQSSYKPRNLVCIITITTMSNNNSNNNNRASLLSGLRTGGVRSTSHSGLPIPHTSAIGGFFNVPGGLNSFQQQGMGMGTNAGYYPPEQDDQYDEQPGYHDFNDQHQHQYLAQSQSPPQGRQTMPMTAAVDGPNNRFLSQQQQQQMLLAQQQAQQQQRQGTPGRGGGQGQQGQGQDALQMQMMQLEILKLQALQAQQYQAEILAQAQLIHQAQAQSPPTRRSVSSYHPPATAGPMATSFGQQAQSPPPRQRFAHLGLGVDSNASNMGSGGDHQQVPMTAALGGRFGMRTGTGGRGGDDDSFSGTTVISGGTSLGGGSSSVTSSLSSSNSNVNSLSTSNSNSTAASTPSKGDAATSWRRATTSGAPKPTTERERVNPITGRPVLRTDSLASSTSSASSTGSGSPPLRAGSASPTKRGVSPSPSPSISLSGLNLNSDAGTQTYTPPRGTPSPSGLAKSRPQPLQLRAHSPSGVGGGVGGEEQVLEMQHHHHEEADPTTPHSNPNSSGSAGTGKSSPLSPREAAARKLYEGLGVGRPGSVPQIVVNSEELPSPVGHGHGSSAAFGGGSNSGIGGWANGTGMGGLGRGIARDANTPTAGGRPRPKSVIATPVPGSPVGMSFERGQEGPASFSDQGLGQGQAFGGGQGHGQGQQAYLAAQLGLVQSQAQGYEYGSGANTPTQQFQAPNGLSVNANVFTPQSQNHQGGAYQNQRDNSYKAPAYAQNSYTSSSQNSYNAGTQTSYTPSPGPSSNAPSRQPRGPPSGADELGPTNFAGMARRRASGGLGVLMGRVNAAGVGGVTVF